MALLLPACGSEPRDSRSLAIALESAPLTLDPRDTTNTDTAHVQQLIFNTLVTKGPDYDFAPELALSWQASSDLLEYTRNRELNRTRLRFDRWLADMLAEQSVAPPILLSTELGADDAIVAADPDRVRRVVINLVENAAQALAETPARACPRRSSRSTARTSTTATPSSPPAAPSATAARPRTGKTTSRASRNWAPWTRRWPSASRRS